MPLTAMQRRVNESAPATLHVYHPLGFPSPSADIHFLDAAVHAGAQVLELGIPFSDPVADGPVLQQASVEALAQGATWSTSIATIRMLRHRHPTIGLVVMAYANTLHVQGWKHAAQQLAAAGADAVIVPDMPLREARHIAPLLRAGGLAWIPLVSSTVPLDTIKKLSQFNPPFVYASSLGVTGQAGPGTQALRALASLREALPDTPVAIGFGVRSAGDVRALTQAGADGIVIGTALVCRIQGGATPTDYASEVRALHGGAHPKVQA